jgi:hypothetical protein
MRFLLLTIFASVIAISCKKEQDQVLDVDFSYEIINNNYTVPVNIALLNKTTGTALFYKWTFTNANVNTYDGKDPGQIVSLTPGVVKITLEAWNDFERKQKTIEVILDSLTIAKFKATPRINDITPVEYDFDFEGQGATQYSWTFQNASIPTSTEKNPRAVLFTQPGTHKVFLEVKNARGVTDTITKWVTVRPPLNANFFITPSFDDEDDYEAPLVATLSNMTISGTTHAWSCVGGIITNPSDSIPTIKFDNPGSYTVSYNVGNGKQQQTVNKTIIVKPNTSLRTFNDVHLGINSAHPTIGSFFSTKLRRVFIRDSVNNQNGPFIDICFFGLSSSFSFNKFISPDSVHLYTFTAIPGATKTMLVNKQESCNCGTVMSGAAFDNVTNGNTFNSYSVVENAQGLGDFSNASLPRVVLFKNNAGKKGAIKIKQFVSNGSNSYIVCDIKVQKD